ncbi:hypothetical protein GpartN1_g4782.t1 [Galdieria partita]|uniref:Centromere protein J C-terminal domain-containing protein n=1 Tax=Galdieria partita TaxID=83374 RepID=A0A9C7Q000_9RHOD|nr:hypothetical protein GpartN1_g4782.t1 [Galdieria partita]
MTSHYHDIWKTLQGANQELRQWLQENYQEQQHNHTTTASHIYSPTTGYNKGYSYTQLPHDTCMVDLEMEIVKELEQSLCELDTVNKHRNHSGGNLSYHDYTPSQLSHTHEACTADFIESNEDDLTLLHRNTHRSLCKTIDCILDQDAKSLYRMKESWQQLHQWSSRHLHPYLQNNSQPLNSSYMDRNNHTGEDEKVYIEETPFYKRLIFPNGNCKEIYSDGRRETYYASSHIHKMTFPNGCRLIFFPNGQLERHLSDGRIEVIYMDGSIGLVSKDGTQERLFLGNGKVVSRNIKYNHRNR